MEKYIERTNENEEKNEKKEVVDEKNIQIIDEEGYDIVQFLCRCGSKTNSKY